ncbi:MAG: energy-coupling factor transporter transmembrane protein EcfT [Chloroflexi bacterium]|nr:energy-coupling factor transporter transmembrane protein EcfT [Chloroflexota bacterium]
MLVTWKYRERNTIIQKLDPRARFIFMLCMLFSIIQFWDSRVMLLFLAISLGQFVVAKITFRETRRVWLLVGGFITFLTMLAFVTGRGGTGVYTEEHVLFYLPSFTLPILGRKITFPITAERIMFGLSQMTRMLAISGFAIIIPYTVDPRLYGVTFRGLGLPDKFAYATDLAFRFVPTLGRDFSITLDAQKARGYELERFEGGIIGQIRKLAPLIVPVTIGAIVAGEEIADAMDLRAFGVAPRTWLHQLTYQRRDKILIAISVGVFLLSTVLSILGWGRFWIPGWLLRMAKG